MPVWSFRRHRVSYKVLVVVSPPAEIVENIYILVIQLLIWLSLDEPSILVQL